jgi:hypothetical protein
VVIYYRREGEYTLKNYPIKPKDLDTSRAPMGFDILLGDYRQMILLWTFVQFWQTKGSWDPFTHEEFMSFIDDPRSKVNDAIKCGVMYFVEPRLTVLLNIIKSEDGNKNPTYYPTHRMIAAYFLGNPAEHTLK